MSNGDLGSSCTGAATDAGLLQGSCATADEFCFNLWGSGTQCYEFCASGTDACPGTSTCANVGTEASPVNVCFANCLPSEGSSACQAQQVCVPSTPNAVEGGICEGACTSTAECNANPTDGGAARSLTCTGGICRCTRNSDCSTDGSLDCDTANGTCYAPCGTGGSCASGCCATEGSIEYCDATATKAATSSGSTGSSGSSGSSGTSGTECGACDASGNCANGGECVTDNNNNVVCTGVTCTDASTCASGDGCFQVTDASNNVLGSFCFPNSVTCPVGGSGTSGSSSSSGSSGTTGTTGAVGQECGACDSSGNCSNSGLCVTDDDNNVVCTGATCTDSSTCASGDTCLGVTDGDGNSVGSFCFPTSEACPVSGTSGSTGTCSPATSSIQNGDLGASCHGAFTDGGVGQGSCATNEFCYDLFGDRHNRCYAFCDDTTDACPGTAICVNVGSSASPSDLCFPDCDPTGAACPDGLGCYAQSPGAHEAGICYATCSDDTFCNGSDGTTFACVGGSCFCTQDTDCSTDGSEACDAISGTCYTPCTDSSSCSSGCCAAQGSVDYCDASGQ